MVFHLFLWAEHPTEGRAHANGNLGLRRIAIGIDERTIVFGMLGHEVDEGLETGAATSFDLDVLRGFEERLHFAQIDVKPHDVDLFDAVFEETVDGGVEVCRVTPQNDL